MYALKVKDKNTFSCWATTEKRLDERVTSAFWSWRGCQPKGSDKTIVDFMSHMVKVKVTVEQI